MSIYQSVHSVCNWNSVDLWESYLEMCERVLESPLTHLDKRDPIRRKVAPGSLREQSEYACSFTPDDGNIHMWGEFREIGARCTLIHHRSPGMFEQNVFWNLPDEFASSRAKACEQLFRESIQRLAPFYGYTDYDYWVAGRYPGGGPLNFQAELRGIAWMTYFSRPYVHFFGEDKLMSLPGAKRDRRRGVFLKLSDSPDDIELSEKLAIQDMLGKQSFFNPRAKKPKKAGENALLFDDLRKECPKHLQW